MFKCPTEEELLDAFRGAYRMNRMASASDASREAIREWIAERERKLLKVGDCVRLIRVDSLVRGCPLAAGDIGIVVQAGKSMGLLAVRFNTGTYWLDPDRLEGLYRDSGLARVWTEEQIEEAGGITKTDAFFTQPEPDADFRERILGRCPPRTASVVNRETGAQLDAIGKLYGVQRRRVRVA